MSNGKMDLERTSSPDDEAPARYGAPRTAYYPERNHYGDEGGLGDGNVQLRELWRRIIKHKWMIALIAVIVTTVVTIEVFRIKSIYQATATIEIKSENRTLFRSGDVVIEADESDYGYYASIAIKTKIRVLQSRPLLEDVAVILKLDQNPKFLDVTTQKTIWEAIKTISSKFGQPSQTAVPVVAANATAAQWETALARSPEESARLSPLVDVLAGNLTVDPVEGTRMLTVSFRHSDPALAAAVVNTVAEVFKQYSSKSKNQKYTDTSAWLDTRTRELRAKVEQAEQALADYTSSHNIFSTDGRENLTTEKLSRLHTQATQAETERILKQSLYEEVKLGRLAQLPEAFADPKTVALQTRLGELQTQEAQLSVKFGPENPRVTEVQKQVATIQRQIEEGRKMLAEKLKADYERAVRDEISLKSALEQAKTEAAQQSQSAIQFSILKQNVETAKALYTDFLQKTNQASIQVADQQKNVEVIEPAGVPVAPVGPKRLRTILIGLLVSLTFGVGLAFAIEYLNNTIKTVDDIDRYVNLPALAVIPAMNGGTARLLSTRKESASQALSVNGSSQATRQAQAMIHLLTADNHSLFAEAYRGLRTSVLLSAAGSPPKTILFTSSQPGEGKTTTTVNTAIALAQLGVSVLIIDADMRRPTVHKVFGVDHAHGLSTYLSREVEIDGLIQKLPIPNLSLMTCGPIPPNPAELVSSEKMKDLLSVLETRYDHILIDSPPLINVTDPVVLSTLVQGVILVVHGGRSKRAIVSRARRELTGVGAKIFGVVLNNVDLKREGYDDYYYYRYHSNYYGQERAGSSGD
jgi:capsular exopolysaccharide synthesis family protein